MKDLKELLDSFGKLPPYVQLLSILSLLLSLVLVTINPAAGVAISGFLLTLKTLFGKIPLYVQLLSMLGFFAILIMIAINPAAGTAIISFLLTLKTLL